MIYPCGLIKSKNCDVLMTDFVQENRICVVLKPIKFWWGRLEKEPIGKRINILWGHNEMRYGSRH
jgi:hypothetical protein